MAEHDRHGSSADEWTLRFGPLWILSALVGRCRFDDVEKAALWDAVAEVAVGSPTATRRILESLAAERAWVFDEFVRDDRPVVSGLLAVSSILDRVDQESGDGIRASMLRIGRLFARARGPFGRTVTLQDEQQLILVEQLLMSSTDARQDNPLNSYLPI